ncbi:XRE family transcriptional regulator [Sporofaciens musculi]|uniref:XRE family transcriptional regulator n=1 Tax=Sporofaciens musculi TaxID=2681861 RepID=UPI0025A04274|nr:XRE family transcriptional regulator [Sporofaciens musculi]
MSFGDRLKEARIMKGYTQKQLAEKLNIGGTTVTGYEKDNSEPSMNTISKIMEILDVDANFLFQDESYETTQKEKELSEKIKNLAKKYRDLDSFGRQTVDIVLDREITRVKELSNMKERMKELETSQATVIDIQPRLENNARLIEYHHSASAGTGVFILGSEGVDQLPIPDTPENRKVDYAIKVSGNSMEPDYYDGDIVLVSQKVELNHGDVGIFIINNNAYIKEYGETELISRNPEVDNITISEYDNIVCMGKVVGKYGE